MLKAPDEELAAYENLLPVMPTNPLDFYFQPFYARASKRVSVQALILSGRRTRTAARGMGKAYGASLMRSEMWSRESKTLLVGQAR